MRPCGIDAHRRRRRRRRRGPRLGVGLELGRLERPALRADDVRGGTAQRPDRRPRPRAGSQSTRDAVWVAISGDDVVARIDPSASSIVTIPVGDGPEDVVVGGGSRLGREPAGRHGVADRPRDERGRGDDRGGERPVGPRVRGRPRLADRAGARSATSGRRRSGRAPAGARCSPVTRSETNVGSLRTLSAASGAASRASLDVEGRRTRAAAREPAASAPHAGAHGRRRPTLKPATLVPPMWWLSSSRLRYACGSGTFGVQTTSAMSHSAPGLASPSRYAALAMWTGTGLISTSSPICGQLLLRELRDGEGSGEVARVEDRLATPEVAARERSCPLRSARSSG